MAGAWRPTVGAGLPRTLGITSNTIVLRWQVTDSPNLEDASAIAEGVFSFGRGLATAGQALPLACTVREEGLLIAGGVGRTEFSRLFVSSLWVAQPRRGQGIGTEVLERMEAEAQARGCKDSIIETLNDRIAGLYARLGYHAEAVVIEYVGPFNRHIMLKRFISNRARGTR